MKRNDYNLACFLIFMISAYITEDIISRTETNGEMILLYNNCRNCFACSTLNENIIAQ